MKSFSETFLSKLDSTVRWTGMPARVADEMSDDPSVDRKHRPLRWTPIWPIAFTCALFILCLAWPPALDRFSPGALIAVMGGFMACILGTVPAIHTNGPLGKASIED